MLFRPLFVDTFDNEQVIDGGGASAELYSLFWEQLKDKVIDVPRSSTEPPTKRHTRHEDTTTTTTPLPLFEQAGNGAMCLPTRITDEDLLHDLQSSSLVGWYYYAIGKVYHKAVIDGCPIPPSFASDFLIDYFLDEEPQQQRVSIRRVVKELLDLDQGFEWVKGQIVKPQGPFAFPGTTVGDLLDNDDGTLIGVYNWEAVVRRFFIAQVRGGGGGGGGGVVVLM